MDKLDLGNKGAGIVGGALGAAIGLVGGPAGSMAGAALGSIVADTLKDMAARVLSHRERVRVDNATAYIADGIERNIAAGLIVRQDDFFVGDANFSGNGAELLEGILLKCRAQYQEKKVQLIANLFKNTAFDASVSAQAAYHILNIADELTYFQLCIVAYYGRKEEFPEFAIINTAVVNYKSFLKEENLAAARDLLRLVEQGILIDEDADGFIGHEAVTPSTLMLDSRGKSLFRLLELNQVPTNDILPAVGPLEYQASWGADVEGWINGRRIDAL